ncbi:Putative mating-type protein MAT alpha 1, HMG-box [Septoria linicola]|uniref:Mating-type protein MAT-1 n=1 Tax=Septoria linicola TaxID=215465 RepID=A0A9Q9AJQ2_9PEZI|nr:putative mating-type protein MAT alpha 1, HMG-box [Septoria linicola]USW50599.1 Putative mating-type protein MAT alpha 1, HMG-box [Septoria linicola]
MATDTMTDTFRNYLEHCSEEMASQIITALRQAGDRPVPNVAQSMPLTASAVSKPQKKQRRKAKSDVETGGPKRPLNSWMAYRKFYNRVLQGYTQKAISKCLTQMWKADPFTAKWALLAKAYSIVRGSGEKKDAPLDEFFVICADAVGVIPPDYYMGALGWSLLPPLAGDPENVPQLVRDREPSLNEFNSKYTMTNLGVDELVKMCGDRGFGQLNNIRTQTASTHGSLTMASRPTVTMADDLTEATDFPFSLTDDNFGTEETATTNPTFAEHPQQMFTSEFDLPDLTYDTPPLTVARAAGQQLLEQAYNSFEQIPDSFPNLLTDMPQPFNPHAANEDSWDAYNINAFMGDLGADRLDFSEYLHQ